MSLPYEPPRKWEPQAVGALLNDYAFSAMAHVEVMKLLVKTLGEHTYELHPSDEAILRGGAPE